VEELLVADPSQARPQVTGLRVGTASRDWEPVVPDLLASGPFDPHFVVETGNDGRAMLRFGDGQYGMAPPDVDESAPGESAITVTYRVGVGRSGNVGADSLVHVVAREPLPLDWPVIAPVDAASPKPVRNPLAAWGGLDPEPIEQVKQLAPAAFRAEQLRAVTEEDYARVAEKHHEVSRAVATFRWTGSWHTVFVTVDPVGRTDVPLDLENRIRDWISRFTQAGYDLEIDPPVYVPLEIWIDVCVAPDHFRADVEEALLEALGNRGFFQPDNFTFGQALHLSRLYAAVERVEGVDSALITRFQRFGLVADGELEQGSITMGRLEIVRLDNDPSFPENGVLQLNMLGGR
jgi:predicted phage baseplate assembly protein